MSLKIKDYKINQKKLEEFFKVDSKTIKKVLELKFIEISNKKELCGELTLLRTAKGETKFRYKNLILFRDELEKNLNPKHLTNLKNLFKFLDTIKNNLKEIAEYSLEDENILERNLKW